MLGTGDALNAKKKTGEGGFRPDNFKKTKGFFKEFGEPLGAALVVAVVGTVVVSNFLDVFFPSKRNYIKPKNNNRNNR